MTSQEAVCQVLSDYYAAFSTLNVQAILPYFHEPALLVGPQGVIPVPTGAALIPIFGAAMEDLHLPYAGEQEYSRMVLIEKGVRPGDIRILKPRILNTADELHIVAEALDQQRGARVIVVTSKAHTRRVRALWEKASRGHGSGRILVRAAPEDYFDASHWWRSTPDALSVVREYLGLLNVWAGLPVTHTK